ncbi:MAG: hypothetical protein ACFFAO_04430 [Candidatus Hermodarchaeota archaeon]
MEKIIKIRKIYLNFSHNNKSYILFRINQSQFDFLYFIDNQKKNKSLLFGLDFLKLIQNYSNNNPKVECIECNLGINVKGGVSLDGNDQVEFNFTIHRCNEILAQLKKKLKVNSDLIEFF